VRVLHEPHCRRQCRTAGRSAGYERQLDQADIALETLDPPDTVVLEAEELAQLRDEMFLVLSCLDRLVPDEPQMLVAARVEKVGREQLAELRADRKLVLALNEVCSEQLRGCGGALREDVRRIELVDERVDELRRRGELHHLSSSGIG
jgi:hypothetical protein